MSTLPPPKRGADVLAPRPLIDVRQVLMESNPFGPEQVKQLRGAVAATQVGDVRQVLAELLNQVQDGDTSKRNHLALGIASYLMARHAQAIEYLEDFISDNETNSQGYITSVGSN